MAMGGPKQCLKNSHVQVLRSNKTYSELLMEVAADQTAAGTLEPEITCCCNKK